MDAEIHIANYCLLRSDRNRKGGGVCAYIRSDVVFKERKDLDSAAIEAIWLDIFLPKSKPILVGICYRPPDQNDFYERLDEILSVSNFNIGQEMIITGDINNYRNFWANYNMHVKGKICKITLLKYPKKH